MQDPALSPPGKAERVQLLTRSTGCASSRQTLVPPPSSPSAHCGGSAQLGNELCWPGELWESMAELRHLREQSRPGTAAGNAHRSVEGALQGDRNSCQEFTETQNGLAGKGP